MVEVKLHDIGEGMTEADINCYLVKAGDYVKADDPLVEVQTDKMTAEIPAPKSGIVKQILLSPGETVKVGTTLLIMEDDQQSGSKTEVKAEAPLNEQEPAINSVISLKEKPIAGRILASPYTRKIARENNVDIMKVNGTGPAGRITDEDVFSFIKLHASEGADLSEGSPVNQVPKRSEAGSEMEVSSNSQPASEEVTNGSEPGSEMEFAQHGAKVSQAGSEPGKAAAEHVPFRGRRKQIARKMVQSLYTIPHCTHFEEIDVSELIRFREEIKAAGNSISATAFFIKALSIGLKEFPIFNAKLDEENERIQLIREHHFGIAVDTAEGLIVPVIRNVEQKNLKQIHEEMKRLTQLALDDKLAVKDISGGTFTISNVGPLGGSIGATPIIQHPQTALISFHKTKKRPVVIDDDQIAVRSIMNLSMAFDHRVADGATAVAFTNRFAQLIENPKMMLLELM